MKTADVGTIAGNGNIGIIIGDLESSSSFVFDNRAKDSSNCDRYAVKAEQPIELSEASTRTQYLSLVLSWLSTIFQSLGSVGRKLADVLDHTSVNARSSMAGESLDASHAPSIEDWERIQRYKAVGL